MKIQEESKSNLTIQQEVFDVIRQNVNRILNIYNVNNTNGLKNFTSCIDCDEAKKAFKEVYPHINYVKAQPSNNGQTEMIPEYAESRIREK